MSSGEKISKMLADLQRVGPEKPLGYLPLNTLKDICKVDPADMVDELEKRQISTKLFNDDECSIWGGALYAYDEQSLGILLLANTEVLESNNWPIEPGQFVNKVATTRAEANTPLFRLIADAFADYHNKLRTRLPKKIKILKNTSPTST